jgi:CRISPR-associated protein Cas1
MAFLYITEQGAVLKKAGERLIVEKDDNILLDIPAAKIEGVLIFGNVQFTTQAVQLMFRQGVEMALFTRHGKLLGQITSPLNKNVVLRQRQYALQADPAFSIFIAKVIVKAKLQNGLEFVREFNHNHPGSCPVQLIDRFTSLSGQVEFNQDLKSLLGAEGAAAVVYFDLFKNMLLHSFQFNGRRKRPATDPVNALLSLGYTLIYNEIESLLDGMGFDPYLGFYHQPRYGHATLASDLMEEFRAPLVDRLTLNLINNRILKEDDFFVHQPSGAVYLKDDARKRYFVEYDHFVTRPMPVDGEKSMTNYRALFKRQAERLKKAISEGTAYEPYIFKW